MATGDPTEVERMTSGEGKNVILWLDGLEFNRFHIISLIVTGGVLVAGGYNLQMLAFALPLISKEWGLTPVQGGTLISWGFLGLMAGALAFGALSDRIGRRRCIVAAISLFSLASFCASFVSDYRSLSVMRFITGFGIGGAFPLTVALLAEFSPASTRGRLVAAAVSGFTLGWAFAALVSMAIAPHFGWRMVFRLALTGVMLPPILVVSLPESVRFLVARSRTSEAERAVRRIEWIARLKPGTWSAVPDSLETNPSGGSLAILFRRPVLLMTVLIWATYFLNTTALYGLSSWLPSLLVKEGIPLVKSFSYGMVQAMGSATGGFVLGCIMDRFGRKPGLIVTYLLGGLSVLLFGSVTNNISLFVAGAATGIFVVGTPTALNVVCSEIYPTSARSTGIAATQAVARIGSILGPMLGGFLQAMGLSFRQFSFLFAIPCFVCTILVFFFPMDMGGKALEEAIPDAPKGTRTRRAL
jgi:MFS transporter, AAHS family, benzoate transport protein